jgi:hypothetical protein
MGEMVTKPQSPVGWRLKPWQTILLFGILLPALTGFGTLFDVSTGIGMFFVYVVSYFNALIVILPILLIRRFGVGTAVYLPYAVVGFFVEYYMELMRQPVLVNIWAVIGWCVFGLVTGLCADAAFHFLQVKERWRAMLMGIVIGSVNFLLTLLALTFFYVSPLQVGPGSFIGMAYFGVPWLLINSAFGGYTAYAISRNIRRKGKYFWRIYDVAIPA